ncbi:MAG: helix-turn-helix transcriptional regulator [bacterium]|nr:helix-turn-helix transcriptional regulator [bacterium]
MRLFWEKGYAQTSMDDVVHRTGVQRYGIYSTFGAKERLFQRALDLYRDEVAVRWMEPLERSTASLPEIRTFFEQFQGAIHRRQSRLGCLMVMTSMESSPLHAQTRKRVAEHFRRLQAAFAVSLGRARSRGRLRSGVDTEETAAFLLGATIGLMAYLRSPAPRDAVAGYLRCLTGMIDTLELHEEKK